MFSVNYIFLLNIPYVFAIITCLGFLVIPFQGSYRSWKTLKCNFLTLKVIAFEIKSLKSLPQHHRVELVCVEGRGRISLHGQVLPKPLNWVAVYSSVTFHING